MKKVTKKELKRLEKKAIKKQFKEWSEAVKTRDNNKCVICGKTERLNAHHIIPRQDKRFRFDLDNGISLCSLHHQFSRENSPHKNPFVFILWLSINRKEQFLKLVDKWATQEQEKYLQLKGGQK
jgi:hypothetical protein